MGNEFDLESEGTVEMNKSSGTTNHHTGENNNSVTIRKQNASFLFQTRYQPLFLPAVITLQSRGLFN